MKDAGGITAQLIGFVSMVVYVCALQHIYAEMAGKPDRSWVNEARTWWVTRGSRKVERRFQKTLRVLTLQEAAEEPSPGG